MAFSFTSCSKVVNFIKESVNTRTQVSIMSFADATEENLNQSLVALQFEKDNYRLVKLNCELKNKSPFRIGFSEVYEISNDDFYLPYNAVSTIKFCISENDSIYEDIYIYYNNELTDENEIREKLDKLKIKLTAYKVDD